MSYDEDDEDYEDDREIAVGARVQQNNRAAEPIGGVIESIDPAETQRTSRYWELSQEEQAKMYYHANIKWDDGTYERIREGYISLEDTKLEREFRKAAIHALEEINKRLAIASNAIDEAEEIAEKYGVPFSADVSPLGQSYFPGSTSSLYENLSKDFIQGITGAYHSEYGEEGWQHSAVCY